MKFPIVLLIAAVALFVMALAGRSEELLVTSMLTGGASVVAYIAVLRARLATLQHGRDVETRLAELERRLGLTERELEATRTELEELGAAREFDRQLLGAAQHRP